MTYETLLFDLEDGVATVTMNRPEAANALNLQMAKDLFYAAIECSENPEIRAVVLTGAGKLFSGGGDLQFFSKQENLQKTLKAMTTFLHGAVSRFVRGDAPCIAAVNGTAGGGGFSLVCGADLAIMSESA
ncbi:MAG: enoyl-CoA hydratase/isomerase family protein, partial [Chloroflexota bacterium]